MDSCEASPRPSFLVLLLELTDGDFRATAQPPARLSYCAPFYTRHLSESAPAVASNADAADECRGHRVPSEIFIATISPQNLAVMAEQQPLEPQPSTEPKPPSLSLAPSVTIERAFFSGNPSAGLTHGLLHLLKDTGDWGTARPSMLVMLSVPAHMTVVDLAQFVAVSGSDLLEMKVIRDRSPGQFMVLLQFTNQTAADRFYSTQHGAPFNSLEPDVTCCLAYVARIDTRSQGCRFPVRDLVELPTCPVCLDRLDEPLRGILTILCNHSFHLRCLDKWHEASCPVCRYVATPPSADGNRCARCGETDNLWICLICGYVGCGRYTGGHAYEHFSSTSHTFAMEVGTDRVWDYCGDNFVHRLVLNKADGKLVQVGGDAPDDKLDAVTLEYTYLLTSQLESQRLFYEEQLERQAENLREAALQAEQEREQRLRASADLEEARRERAALDKRLGHTSSRLQKLQKELDEERGFNAGLTANQRELQDKLMSEQSRRLAELRKKDEELEQLREEMRDLYAHLEAGQQLAAQLSQDEAAASQLMVGEQQPGRTGSGAAAAGPSKKRSGRK